MNLSLPLLASWWLAATLASVQDSKPASMPDLATMRSWQFVLLKPGKTGHPEDPPEMAAEQQFLARLFKEKKAAILGPCAGGKEYFGAMVLDAKTPDAARQMLADEPFVKAGYLEPEVRPWFGPKDAFGAPTGAVTDSVGCVLGILRRRKDAPAKPAKELQEIQAGHLQNIMTMSATGDLFAAGPFMDNGELRGLLMFRIEDQARIRELVAKDPAVQSGRLVLDLVSWRVPKGTIAPPAKK